MSKQILTPRRATLTRTTTETNVSLTLSLDGMQNIKIHTGFGMLDHMLSLLAFWAGFDLSLQCEGDLHVDAHHSVEDSALCLGQALDAALGDRKGIARTGSAKVPMDEAIAEVCVDLSGRPYLVFRGQERLPPLIGGEESDLWREFFKALAVGCKMNLHITLEYGANGHHLLESAYKGLGLALRAAVTRNRPSILSTKGSLD
ncbi:MAG: imidazoleglycerol-phosphate dehydratase HisB [Desulfovibrio sp.]|jgi:imidazoleglycerol-phosphate dehydratase|nr:imidazoleglycerol-phosphate dehydratase HisB [Desulfovibrio sp.]